MSCWRWGSGPNRSNRRSATWGDVRIHYAVEPEPLDTGGAIAFAARHVGVDGTFIVANGDIITDLDLALLVDAHHRLGTHATLHLTPVDDPSAFGVVEVGDDGIIQRFVEKPAPGETESDLVNAGTYVFEPSVLDLIPDGARRSVERDVFPVLASDGRLGAWATDDYWIDAGRPESYLRANLDLASGRRDSVVAGLDPGARVAATATVRNVVVGNGASVGSGAIVEDSLLLSGAEVGEQAVVRRSIIAGAVGAAADVSDSVIGDGYRVVGRTIVVDERLPRSAP